jgi:hypothetical protein
MKKFKKNRERQNLSAARIQLPKDIDLLCFRGIIVRRFYLVFDLADTNEWR